ncbi:hypothetical protein B0H17DRAFT_946085 [Mycena rosella]|uniref:Uncharacterized protein n=1 Tax=Mycena rosella TaxID=1033263 RepID=A0AAD7D287_MYCRO|nr:hypothetical protein B0H17DRAFT_946085 [Mycena rosella]
MVQFGWNAGPRHARVFGLAKSFTKDFDDKTKTNRDTNIIAATTVVWGVAKAQLPTEITDAIDRELLNTGMPRIASRNVAEGTGFHIKLNGTDYTFPIFERAPPEAYLTREHSA